MDFVRDELKAIVSNLKIMERNYITEMSSSPVGSLLNNYSRGKGRFYHSYYVNGARRRHYLKPDDPMIEKLARKEYLRLDWVVPRL